MTPEEATERQIERWRRLSLEERLRIVFAMIEDGFALVAASIRAAHPEYTPEAFRAALRFQGLDSSAEAGVGDGPRKIAAGGADGQEGTDEEIDRDRRVGRFHLRHARLTRLQPLRQFDLGQPVSVSPLAERAA